eukprot:m.101879 g.101879  ORF g.101879 m.101879 type:complete len:633 (+) comp37148_c0_seq18:83-1981(+)
MQEPVPGTSRYGAPFGPDMGGFRDRFADGSNPVFVPMQGPKGRAQGAQPQAYKYSRSPSSYSRDFPQGPASHQMFGRLKPPNPGAHAFVPGGIYGSGYPDTFNGPHGPVPVTHTENSYMHHNMTGTRPEMMAGAPYYPQGSSVVTYPDGHVYSGPPSHVAHLTSSQAGYTLVEEFRQDLLHRHMAGQCYVSPSEMSEMPQELDGYHSLCPLESVGKEQGPGLFGFKTTCYKAVNAKSSVTYALRRIHGFRLGSARSLQRVEQWKKLSHPNVVSLREVFTTKQFGDHSLVFTHDYHPGAETLAMRHFGASSPRSTSIQPQGPSSGSTFPTGSSSLRRPQPFAGSSQGFLPENLIWTYCIQLTAAVKAIHERGLAIRALDVTKILITGKSRLRLSCVGVMDVLTFHLSQNSGPLMGHYQHEDLMSLGRILLALACNSLAASQRDQLHKSLEVISLHYSVDLKNLIVSLLSSQQSMRTIADIMPMIGARFYTQIENSLNQSDLIEAELLKEMENGRLFRLLTKLGVINERPEFQMDPAWSETGDRYLLKLFRDYLFHQVTETGAPWIDLSHIVQTLNKLDAASPEQVCLVSRDEQSVVVISYERLKSCLQAAFSQLVEASSATPPSESFADARQV